MAGTGHQAARRAEGAPSEAIEDYAKAIYALERRDGGPVSTTALAERLDVSPGTVTAMLKRMQGMGLAAHEPYRGVELTTAGEKVALEVLRHHRLLEAYLVEALGVPWDRVHEEAEVLEHYISEELEERIAEALGEPERDPHGDPIPRPDLSLASDEDVPLADLTPGQRATVARVSDSDPEMLRYLAELGIGPGIELRMIGHEPFGAGVRVEIDGAEHAIGEQLARRVLVGRRRRGSPTSARA